MYQRVGFGARGTRFPDSAMVEQPAVNRFVVGSSPTRGAFIRRYQRLATALNPLHRKGFLVDRSGSAAGAGFVNHSQEFAPGITACASSAQARDAGGS